jgi:hypothetical protein
VEIVIKKRMAEKFTAADAKASLQKKISTATAAFTKTLSPMKTSHGAELQMVVVRLVWEDPGCTVPRSA